MSAASSPIGAAERTDEELSPLPFNRHGSMPPNMQAQGQLLGHASGCARLGLGLTIVNGSCRIPRGLVARPLPELPRRDCFVIMRRMRTLTGSVAQLAGHSMR